MRGAFGLPKSIIAIRGDPVDAGRTHGRRRDLLVTPLSRRPGIDVPVVGAPMACPGIGSLADAERHPRAAADVIGPS
ncbi:hypothetical protein [Actinopolymorpha pittospori]|uniref:Uncharacterized protein n=1 Tax=Actinopolymorpha pittospori TaxID=648752 RepID=A0A927MQQ3_9ACTN|nr:hypothetical protein [Actinopolymorpha pittospori]MBE1605136.1 hypothetical protein [Actinopolymorpha pittospori]